MFIRHACFVLCCTLPACSATASSDADLRESRAAARAGAHYVEARSYWTAPEDIDAWYALTRDLKAQFDAICGDTFCEGDFSNYESLGVRCSVEQQTGALGRCVWTFAASTEEVRPDTGALKIHGKVWKCPLPMAQPLTARQLVRGLSRGDADALYTPVPGTTRSFYDALVECL
jgi:hypothetical protein